MENKMLIAHHWMNHLRVFTNCIYQAVLWGPDLEEYGDNGLEFKAVLENMDRRQLRKAIMDRKVAEWKQYVA